MYRVLTQQGDTNVIYLIKLLLKTFLSERKREKTHQCIVAFLIRVYRTFVMFAIIQICDESRPELITEYKSRTQSVTAFVCVCCKQCKEEEENTREKLFTPNNLLNAKKKKKKKKKVAIFFWFAIVS